MKRLLTILLILVYTISCRSPETVGKSMDIECYDITYQYPALANMKVYYHKTKAVNNTSYTNIFVFNDGEWTIETACCSRTITIDKSKGYLEINSSNRTY